MREWAPRRVLERHARPSPPISQTRFAWVSAACGYHTVMEGFTSRPEVVGCENCIAEYVYGSSYHQVALLEMEFVSWSSWLSGSDVHCRGQISHQLSRH
ncbi:hypothetical protein BU25DRAFT_409526 [Macroventuria anomochaeta]|uniref:Uncharacterized protein n=1 Tax=Macroventuria anomochaeta TaxID=301207 RepID=A0ACB6S486_9PLEO|nr:uncharacterized protein BU25DRAFT_409526 [Macroventuria anomochaeta]KAF2629055.1 hypothetical protein BU25DRAFT_409526 [Macroventuria anomochaeta]